MKEQKQNSPEKGSDNGEELKENEQYKTLQKVKKNLWFYQKREGDLLSRENAVLEKEEKQKQVCFICLSFSCPRSLENSQIFLKKTNQVRNLLSPLRRLNFRQNFVFSPF